MDHIYYICFYYSSAVENRTVKYREFFISKFLVIEHEANEKKNKALYTKHITHIQFHSNESELFTQITGIKKKRKVNWFR